MCKCGNIAAAPLFTHYYKQKTAEKQVIGGKSAVDKGKFFCGRPWSQIVELSTVFPSPSPARAEELPRSARRRADLGELSRKSPKLSTEKNNCTLIFAAVSALFALKEAVFPSVSGSIGGAFVRRKSGGRGGVRFVCRESAYGLAAILKTSEGIAPAIVARTGFCMHRRFVFALRCMLALSQEGRHLLRRKAADTPLRRGADRQPSEKMAGFACWAGRYML